MTYVFAGSILLDNAIEACGHCTDKGGVTVRVANNRETLTFTIKNILPLGRALSFRA